MVTSYDTMYSLEPTVSYMFSQKNVKPRTQIYGTDVSMFTPPGAPPGGQTSRSNADVPATYTSRHRATRETIGSSRLSRCHVGMASSQ